MKISEILTETPEIGTGDYNAPDLLTNIPKDIFDKNWVSIGSLNNFKLIKNESNNFILVYAIGDFDNNKFITIGKIVLHKINTLDTLGYKNLYRVGVVLLNRLYQKSGLAKNLYRFLTQNEKIAILGDQMQFFGARKLWVSLSKDTDVQVDIVDIDKKQILFTNIILHHGNYEKDYDKRIWSLGPEKKNIRPILINI